MFCAFLVDGVGAEEIFQVTPREEQSARKGERTEIQIYQCSAKVDRSRELTTILNMVLLPRCQALLDFSSRLDAGHLFLMVPKAYRLIM
jgi:hypothetical protein